MAQFQFIHIGNPSPGAKLVAFLVLVLVLAILVAIGVLAIGMFLIVAPFVVLGGLALYVFRALVPRAPSRRPHDPNIIEGEYRVVDPDAVRIAQRDRRDS